MDHLISGIRELHHIAASQKNGVYNGIKICDDGSCSIPMSGETDLM